jgi:uncharacterized membrane protein
MKISYLLQHKAPQGEPLPETSKLEAYILPFVEGLELLIETISTLIIGLGVAIALYYFVRSFTTPQVESYNKIRLILARYLALALEFQLGADILSTAIAPSWDHIGKLGAIAVIRTALNYFLSLEMRAEQKEVKKESQGNFPAPDPEP